MSQHTHNAIVTVAPRAPLQLISVPTPVPKSNEIRIRGEWTASTPLDLHQADGGLLVTHPQVLGDGVVGTVVEIGGDVERFVVGDVVFGFCWRGRGEKTHQEFVVGEEGLFGGLPENIDPREAVTVPNNLVTAFHTLTHDLGFELPFPKPDGYIPPSANAPILVWGASSSVGQYIIQVLHYWGYRNIIATASPKHHAFLRELGAGKLVDYRGDRESVRAKILDEAGEGSVRFVVDCIGSLEGSVRPVCGIVGEGAVVAVMLPVVVRDTMETGGPSYEMDVGKLVEWEEGVVVKGVRTHFYLENKFFADQLQSYIIPALLKEGIIKPNRYLLVEGATMLERAEKALDLLRRKVPSAERLVWRINNE